MQQIEIEIVGAETSKACFASAGNAVSRHLIGLHFGDQEYAVALAGNHVAYQFLGESVAVIPRGIDQSSCQAKDLVRSASSSTAAGCLPWPRCQVP